MEKSEFKYQVAELLGLKILVMAGEIDAYTAPQFEHSVKSILDMDVQHLIIDAHNLRYMDSIGLGILISVAKRLNPGSGTVNLVGCKPHIERIFRITKTSAIFALHQNMDDAIAGISPLVSTKPGAE